MVNQRDNAAVGRTFDSLSCKGSCPQHHIQVLVREKTEQSSWQKEEEEGAMAALILLGASGVTMLQSLGWHHGRLIVKRI